MLFIYFNPIKRIKLIFVVDIFINKEEIKFIIIQNQNAYFYFIKFENEFNFGAN